MNQSAFEGCVDAYCRAVGARAGVREHLGANYRVLVGAWKITAIDLGEIAFRFVRDSRIPNWPKEHSEAIGRELDVIRKEKLAAMMPARSSHECRVCGGAGIVIVPHPCCVHRGQVCGYYDRAARIRRREVVTVSVICTAPKCWRGEATRLANATFADERNRPTLITLDKYLAKFEPGFEPTVALREWERSQAEASRRAEEAAATTGRDRDEVEKTRSLYRKLVGTILERQQSWVEREPYRDEAEVDENEAIPV